MSIKSRDGYTLLPALTIGGAAGDYFVICPTVSCEWAEFAIDSIANGDGGTGAVVVSTASVPKALDYTGISTNNMGASGNANTQDAHVVGTAYRIPATTTQIINGTWERIINSEKKVYIRIDPAASTSLYVTLRFRIKMLAVVPGPSVEVHPEHEQQLNIARSARTSERLKDMGIPRYAIEEP